MYAVVPGIFFLVQIDFYWASTLGLNIIIKKYSLLSI